MATSYHQLGNLAQDRGDYDEAERRYTDALTIDEELANRAGMATNYHQLGTLAEKTEDYSGAVAYHVRAAYLRAQLQLRELTFDLLRLRSLREKLGQERFDESVGQMLPKKEAAELTAMLDTVQPPE
jgi:tetratricopeptide (TPR) repeat protein